MQQEYPDLAYQYSSDENNGIIEMMGYMVDDKVDEIIDKVKNAEGSSNDEEQSSNSSS